MSKDKKAKELDLNVGVVSAKAAAAVKSMPSLSSASGTMNNSRASEASSVSMSMESTSGSVDDSRASAMTSAMQGSAPERKKTVRISESQNVEVEYNAESEEKFGEGVLDKDVSLVRRKTIAIKSDNVNDAFMQNLEAITESVNTFNKMSEETFKNDAALIFQ